MGKKLYVGNLPFSVEEGAVQKLFSNYGTVQSVRLISDRATGRPKGFGFVEFENEEDAEKAAQALDGTDFEGRTIKVNEARPMEDRGGRGGPRGGGYGGGGGGYGGGGGGGYGGGGGGYGGGGGRGGRGGQDRGRGRDRDRDDDDY